MGFLTSQWESLSVLISEISRNFWHGPYTRCIRTRMFSPTDVRWGNHSCAPRAIARFISFSRLSPPSSQPPRRLSVQAPAVLIAPGDSRWCESYAIAAWLALRQSHVSLTLTHSNYSTLLLSQNSTGTKRGTREREMHKIEEWETERRKHVAKRIRAPLRQCRVSVCVYVHHDDDTFW